MNNRPPVAENLLQTSLRYPENWSLTGPMEDQDGESLVLESPDGMFMSMNRYHNRSDFEDVLQTAIDAMKQEYNEIEYDDYQCDEAIEDEFGMDLQFYCKNLVVTSRMVAMCDKDDVLLMQIQAEDRDFDRSELVFEAMLKSIRDGIKQKG